MVLSSVWWEGPTHSINTTRGGGGVELTIDRRQGPILGTARVSVNVSLSTSRVGFIGGGGERMGGGGGRQNVSSSSWHLVQWSRATTSRRICVNSPENHSLIMSCNMPTFTSGFKGWGLGGPRTSPSSSPSNGSALPRLINSLHSWQGFPVTHTRSAMFNPLPLLRSLGPNPPPPPMSADPPPSKYVYKLRGLPPLAILIGNRAPQGGNNTLESRVRYLWWVLTVKTGKVSQTLPTHAEVSAGTHGKTRACGEGNCNIVCFV